MAFKEVKLLVLGRRSLSQKPVLVDLLEQVAGFPSQEAWHHFCVDFRNVLQRALGITEPALLF